jgi:Bacterial membrane protein YfhO
MRYWNNMWVRYMAGLAIASFLYSMGNFSLLHGILYAVAPLLWMAREADRFMYLADFALAILAGFGMDALLSSMNPVSWRPLTRALRWIAILSAIALVYPHVLGKGDVDPWISLSLGLIVLSYCLFGYLIRGHNSRWAQFLIVAFILFDLSAFDWSAANRLQESAKQLNFMELLRGSRGAGNFLRARPGMFRVEVEGELIPNIGDVYGIETTMGNAVTLLADYDKMRQHPDLLNVRYRLKPASARDPGSIYEDSQWKVFENATSFPRGWLVHETVLERDDNDTFRRLSSASVDLHHVAIVGSSIRVSLPPPPADVRNEYVSVSRPNGNRLEIDVNSSGKALLVLSELYYPGWRVTVDRHATDVLRVDGDLRGIIVPPGASHVSLYYWSASSRMPIIKSAPGTLDLFEDVGSLGGPEEGFGTLVVFVDVLSDGRDQFFSIVKDAAS